MRKRCAVLVAALLTVGCVSQADRECVRSDDCPEKEFCRMGFCVPAVAHDEVAVDTADGSREPPPRHSDATRPSIPDAADSTVDGRRDVVRCDGHAPDPDDLAVNEILVDVPGGDDGDANDDGTRDAFDDEFVELVNRGDDTLDVSGTELLEGGDVAVTLDAICLDPNTAIVVFGGGSVDVLSEAVDDAVFATADGRLGFSNSSGSFAVRGPNGDRLAEVEWNGPPSESLTLEPQIEGTALKPHSTVVPGRHFSPGRCADGTTLSGGCPVPETTDAGIEDADLGDAETRGSAEQ